MVWREYFFPYFEKYLGNINQKIIGVRAILWKLLHSFFLVCFLRKIYKFICTQVKDKIRCLFVKQFIRQWFELPFFSAEFIYREYKKNYCCLSSFWEKKKLLNYLHDNLQKFLIFSKPFHISFKQNMNFINAKFFSILFSN